MQWLLGLVLVENTVMAYCWAVTSRRFNRFLRLAGEQGTEAAQAYLDSSTARERIARVARSVAKDYLQDQAEARGEVWRP